MTVVSYKGVKMHPKRLTKNIAISSSQLEERLREQYKSINKIPTKWANINQDDKQMDEDAGIYLS